MRKKCSRLYLYIPNNFFEAQETGGIQMRDVITNEEFDDDEQAIRRTMIEIEQCILSMPNQRRKYALVGACEEWANQMRMKLEASSF